MRDHIIGIIVAALCAGGILFGLMLIAPETASATSALYDQYVPVTRSRSVTTVDVNNWFTWTGPHIFCGSVLDDITVGGTFTGHREMCFVVEVEDASLNPDTFMWSSDGGVNWTTGVGMTGGAQTLTEGVTVTFGAVNGHADGENWTWVQHTVGHTDIAADVFTGTGLDDATAGGNYHGTTLRRYRVEIDATGTPDTFQWSQDGGASWVATGVAITGATQHLSDGAAITFAATTGHTDGDYWDFVATPASQQLIIGSINWTCTAVKAASYVTVMDEEDDNQFDIFSYVSLGNGEVIYDPPISLPVGRDLKMDTTCTDTGVIYFNVNAWLRDVNY